MDASKRVKCFCGISNHTREQHVEWTRKGVASIDEQTRKDRISRMKETVRLKKKKNETV